MSRTESYALFNGSSTDNCHNNSLASVIDINLIAGIELHTALILNIAVFLDKIKRIVDYFAFDLCSAHELLIVLAKAVASLCFLIAQSAKSILTRHEKLLAELLCCTFGF